ncbi:MAG TPA: tRNA guanosine(34) transglycosylase Tgt [Patescibacteria group bacterium]|nr:tRNA guanosine(34) transglycosylase Tgt [Patescibacteria group bacterium]
MTFNLTGKSKKSLARTGVLKTGHGLIRTPFFMPIATRSSVKTLTAAEIKKLGGQIVLSNTYHLYLRPGLAVINQAGGLHKFMAWSGPLLTDSGGFQVFSLKDKNAGQKSLVKVSGRGVEFKSVYDGSKHLFTPKKVLEIQQVIGSDIRMVLDVCSPAKCSKVLAEHDLEITLKWAKASSKYKATGNFLLFGIVQGALYQDLRLKSVEKLCRMNFDGYAIGGLAVGESPKEMYQVLDYTVPALPKDKPRYLMGVGYPEQIVAAVKRGIDMFDCVIPTREARHGRLYVRNSKLEIQNLKFYKTVNIKSEKFKKDNSAINAVSKFLELRNYSKAYLRHLFSVGEPLALRLATLNNLEFYLDLMREIRTAIKDGKL